MRFSLKPISKAAIPRAIEKAERYRLLNHAWAAESICLDILEVEPDNQQVLVLLVLALSDILGDGHVHTMQRARDYVEKIRNEYERSYYNGIICERRGQSLMTRGGMGSGSMAYDFFLEAMSWYEKAEAIRPEGDDDAILRWNTCARILEGRADLTPVGEQPYEPALED